jgi:hypothetical protein
MKAIILALGIVVILGLGGLWLSAAPQSAPAFPPPQAHQVNPSSSPQQQASSTAAAQRPLAIAHTIGSATATPNVISVGTSTLVTVTIQISDPALIPSSVNLLRLGAPGTQPTVLGTMPSAGNGIYSLQHVFNESTAGQIQLQISAAFQGSLQRVLSNIATVNVWNSYQNSQLGIALSVPPTFIPKQSIDPVVKQVVFLTPPGASESDVMFLVEIANLPQGLSLLQTIEEGDIDPTSITQVALGGRTYFKWFSSGQGDGIWSYATLYSPTQSIVISTPSSSFALNPAFSELVASLSFPSQ